jgi:SET domain-containing protein
MENFDFLYVDNSNLVPGQKGLFTNKFLPKGTCIGKYYGEIISNREYQKRHELGLGLYGMSFKGKIIDANNSDCILKYMNDANGLIKSHYFNNVKFYEENDGVYAYTTRDVEANSELFAPYGENYWEALKNN